MIVAFSITSAVECLSLPCRRVLGGLGLVFSGLLCLHTTVPPPCSRPSKATGLRSWTWSRRAVTPRARAGPRSAWSYGRPRPRRERWSDSTVATIERHLHGLTRCWPDRAAVNRAWPDWAGPVAPETGLPDGGLTGRADGAGLVGLACTTVRKEVGGRDVQPAPAGSARSSRGQAGPHPSDQPPQREVVMPHVVNRPGPCPGQLLQLPPRQHRYAASCAATAYALGFLAGGVDPVFQSPVDRPRSPPPGLSPHTSFDPPLTGSAGDHSFSNGPPLPPASALAHRFPQTRPLPASGARSVRGDRRQDRPRCLGRQSAPSRFVPGSMRRCA